MRSCTTSSTGSSSLVAVRELTDPLAGVLHRLDVRASGRGTGDASIAGVSPRTQPVMEAEEIQPLARLPQVHDPGLGVLSVGPARQDLPQAPQGRARPPVGCGTSRPGRPRSGPEPRSRARSTAGQAGAGRRCTGRARSPRPAGSRHLARGPRRPPSPRAQHRAQQLQDVAIDDPLLDRRHQPRVRDRAQNSWRCPTRQPTACRSRPHQSRTWSAPCCRSPGSETQTNTRSKSASKIGSITSSLRPERRGRGQQESTAAFARSAARASV